MIASAALALGISETARAQWAPDRAYTEGPGIRVGNLELHPGVAVRGGYDSNVFRTKNDVQGGGLLGITPHLHLTTLKAQRVTQGEDAAGAGTPMPAPVAFDLGLAGTYFQYFGVENAPTNIEADTSATLSVLPERTFGFDVGAAYSRSTRPFTDAGSTNRLFSSRYAFDRISPAITLRGQSRGGVLRGSVGYAPNVLLYESNTFSYLNSVTHTVPAAMSWKFLPYTALLYDGNLGLLQYLDPTSESATNASIFISNSKRFESRVGVNGAVTTRFSLRALVGYAGIFNKRVALDDREDVVGEAAATFAWAPGSNAEVGYRRSLELSPLGGFMQMDRGYAKSTMLFAQVFQLGLEAGAAHVNYGRMLDVGGAALGDQDGDGAGETTKRSDVRIDGGVHGEYRATNWLALMADFTVLANLTDFQYARPTATPFPAQFVTVQAYGGVRFHY